jgi:protein-S-isoprenylcysteine O-methyltransferase Ste14
MSEVSTRSASSRLRLPVSWVLVCPAVIVVLVSSSPWQQEDFRLVGDTLFLAGCLLAGIGAIGRVWCSLYIAGYKSRSLVTVGPYSISRHPLYFFSLLGALGVALATETLLVPLAVLVFFVTYYPFVIKSEERKLLARHGDDYATYQQRTPAFFPQRALFEEPESYLVHPRLFRKHLLSVLWFIWLLGILQVVHALHVAGVLPTWFRMY